MSNDLYKIIAKTLSISESDVSDESGPETIESWDSFNGLVLVDELDRVEHRSGEAPDPVGCDQRQVAGGSEDGCGHVPPLGTGRRPHLLDHGVGLIQRRHHQTAHLIDLVRIHLTGQQAVLNVGPGFDLVVLHDRRIRRIEHLVVLQEAVEQLLLFGRHLRVIHDWLRVLVVAPSMAVNQTAFCSAARKRQPGSTR